MHHAVSIPPMTKKGIHNQPSANVTTAKIAMNGQPAEWIGTNTGFKNSGILLTFYVLSAEYYR
ncbi:MAG: hypothetical protein VXV97_14060, partial [Pseudomonadota bacterium]|nr:hypothetical protein [Pseudomonadota bacterium]